MYLFLLSVHHGKSSMPYYQPFSQTTSFVSSCSSLFSSINAESMQNLPFIPLVHLICFCHFNHGTLLLCSHFHLLESINPHWFHLFIFPIPLLTSSSNCLIPIVPHPPPTTIPFPSSALFEPIAINCLTGFLVSFSYLIHHLT